jgi:hypothetical protein
MKQPIHFVLTRYWASIGRIFSQDAGPYALSITGSSIESWAGKW